MLHVTAGRLSLLHPLSLQSAALQIKKMLPRRKSAIAHDQDTLQALNRYKQVDKELKSTPETRANGPS